ncbi:hypothetical protein [Membranihabitans maritimus]|uniref:hypothetical protein n=1 Tax=Membranihabitans maritimus TaxID=2904244 RepID=UPI001F184540|nr:hypothetical protein [Membranihabitans maritimus]
MIENNLYERLQYVDSSRENRQEIADWILNSPELFSSLLKNCFADTNSDTSRKAFWSLEFVCKKKLEWLIPHLDYFFNHLHLVKNDSSIRSLSKICELLCTEYYHKNNPVFIQNITSKHLDKLTETAFDWLIGNHKVAVKAHSMQCLYYLGTENVWIHKELTPILHAGFNQHSAGYKARARHILKSIRE